MDIDEATRDLEPGLVKRRIAAAVMEAPVIEEAAPFEAEEGERVDVATFGDKPASPIPLPAEGDPAEFPVEALGVVLGDAALALEDMTQAPLALAGQSVLAAASLAAQGLADVEFDPMLGPRPLSLFLVSVARSGERKSALDRAALAPIRSWARSQAAAFRSKERRHQDDLDVYERERRQIIAGKKNPKEKVIALDTLGERPEAPVDPRVVTTSTLTIQGLCAQLKRGRPSIGIFSDEGGAFLGGYAMSADNRQATTAALCSWWEGRAPDGLTKSGGATHLPGRRVCSHLMIQQRMAAELFNDEDLRDQGLMGRILAAWPASTIGTRKRRPRKRTTKPALDAYHNAISGLMSMELQTTSADPRELKPRVLTLEPETERVLYAFGDEVEEQLAAHAKLSDIVSLGAKAAEQSARLAGIVALVDDPGVEAIALPYIEAGIRLMRYYLAEAMRIRNISILSEDAQNAKALLEWLHHPSRSEWQHTTRREIRQSGPRAVRSPEALGKAMAILIDHRWLVPLDEPVRERGSKRRRPLRIARMGS